MLALRQGLVEIATSEAVSEQTILDILHDAKETLIFPITNFWTIQFVLILLGFFLGYALYYYHMVMFSSCFANHLYLMLYGAKYGATLVLCSLIVVAFFSPIHTILLDFYNMIKDELYLVGKQLENAQSKSSATASMPTTTDNSA